MPDSEGEKEDMEDDPKTEFLGLQTMTTNCLKQAGYKTIGKLLALYEKKGVKGFANIPRFNAEMQKELVSALRREKLI